MEKLYEILVNYDDSTTDLIAVLYDDIQQKVNQIKNGAKNGRLFVIEIDTYKGTTVIINDKSVICYYDQPILADIVLRNRNQTKILKPADMTIYVERTIQTLDF